MTRLLPSTVAPVFGLGLVLVLGFTAADARADVVHGGIDLSALVPDGFVVEEVIAPQNAGHPVRVRLLPAANRGAPGATVLFIAVTESRGLATAALDAQLRGHARELTRAPELGDIAYAGERGIFLARDNVFAGIRSERMDGAQLERWAQRVDDAIRHAPAGPARSPLTARPTALSQATFDVNEVALPAATLAAYVAVEGPGYARRTAGGWSVVRTGPGHARVVVTTVDRRLRCTSIVSD
jgi:hypothetical protein